MSPSVLYKLKFKLWDFARVHPNLGKPIQYANMLATRKFLDNHKKHMRNMGRILFSKTRYERDITTPTQCFVLQNEPYSTEQKRGIDILLSHLRIPFRWIEKDVIDAVFEAVLTQPVIIITLNMPWDNIQTIYTELKNKNVNIIAFGISEQPLNKTEKIQFIPNDPAELLPYNLGLRSSLTRRFVQSLLALSHFPIITGFLPPQIGIRIDDVTGCNAENYLPSLIDRSWTPNLGIFIDEFGCNSSSQISYFSLLVEEGRIEISPHAFTTNKFIFFDYENGKPFSGKEFAEIWEKVLRDFDEWKIPLSPILNAHFHAFSSVGYPTLLGHNVKYNFSELSPDRIAVQPCSNYLPSGDPICTTGQAQTHGIFQIFSGDSAQDCNRSDSLYDFLMHTDSNNLIEDVSQRIFKRLSLSLDTGFAAFVTTHEYLLNKLTPAQQTHILEKVEALLSNYSLQPQKAALSEIGRACENHTNILIESINFRNDQWTVTLSGESNGDSF